MAMDPAAPAVARKPTPTAPFPAANAWFPRAVASPLIALAKLPMAMGEALEAVAVAPAPMAIAPLFDAPPLATAGAFVVGDIAMADRPDAEPFPAVYCP